MMLTIEKFNNWCSIKKDLNFGDEREFFINNREVWYISVGANIGNEIYGKSYNFKRPVLVIKKVGNLFFCVSLTTKGRKNSKFNFHLDKKYFNIDNSFLNLSQIKTYDKKRFIENIGTIDEKDFNEIKKDLKKLLF